MDLDDIAYEVLNPDLLYRGRSYCEWTTDWLNWFVSVNADKRTSGPVVYLRSHGLPHRLNTADYSGQVYLTGTLPNEFSTDENRPTLYDEAPNVRCAGERLQIFEDQAVFIPIIVAYGFAVPSYRDFGNLQDTIGALIDNGDNPPDASQLLINSEAIRLNENVTMDNFRITTPIFTTVVPEAPAGTSVKDSLEEGQVPAGTYSAMVDGYFVMVKFPALEAGRKNYWIHAFATAGREPRGPYFSDLLYEIQVFRRPERYRQGRITVRYPAQSDAKVNRILNKKLEHGDLNLNQVTGIQSLREKAKRINRLV